MPSSGPRLCLFLSSQDWGVVTEYRCLLIAGLTCSSRPWHVCSLPFLPPGSPWEGVGTKSGILCHHEPALTP